MQILGWTEVPSVTADGKDMFFVRHTQSIGQWVVWSRNRRAWVLQCGPNGDHTHREAYKYPAHAMQAAETCEHVR